MKTKNKNSLMVMSDYPKDYQLTEDELDKIIEECVKGLSTTNGDTHPIELSVRQVSLLLRSFIENRK